ncbi:endonuclease III domain-containing protein [Almyronema epifaneia]|uniref:Endonuclease III domain-containing protein n=1 Tax=Almyronema epifaneia S1 TaxID=2991925 RepID=A0ABW6IIC1_9CYAN
MPTLPSFEIDLVFECLRQAVQPYPKAAMFELAEQGYDSLFEQLIACILSIRTYDEVSIRVAQRLFAKARTPAAIAQLSLLDLNNLIQKSTFADRKAVQIQAIAQQILADYNGELPADPAILSGFNGVGPKCTHLALGVALGYACISVDIHVHRVTNRWGYVQTKTPEKTLKALEAVLPQRYWIEINKLLVPFGKHICKGSQPQCRTCPLLDLCAQVGVDGS